MAPPRVTKDGQFLRTTVLVTLIGTLLRGVHAFQNVNRIHLADLSQSREGSMPFMVDVPSNGGFMKSHRSVTRNGGLDTPQIPILPVTVQEKKCHLTRKASSSSHHRNGSSTHMGKLVKKCVQVSVVSFVLCTSNLVQVSAFDASTFTGDYADPFHPLCQRHIEVSSDGSSFQYSGTAVGPKDDPIRRGCSKEEQEKYGSRQGSFEGKIILDGRGISAGDGIHEGVWEGGDVIVAKGLSGAGVDGIRWNDGNKWTKLYSPSNTAPESTGNVIGKWITLVYIGFSFLAGAKEVFVRVQKRLDNSS